MGSELGRNRGVGVAVSLGVGAHPRPGGPPPLRMGGLSWLPVGVSVYRSRIKSLPNSPVLSGQSQRPPRASKSGTTVYRVGGYSGEPRATPVLKSELQTDGEADVLMPDKKRRMKPISPESEITREF